MPYHSKLIPVGKVGEISKIEEEIAELKDAVNQNNKVMALVELSDICGSIICYLEKHFPDISIEDLIIMSKCTISAFKDGTRSSKTELYRR